LFLLPLLWRGRIKVGEGFFFFISPSYILPLKEGEDWRWSSSLRWKGRIFFISSPSSGGGGLRWGRI